MRVKEIALRILGGFWREPPDNIAIFGVVLINAKCAVCECMKIKVIRDAINLICDLCS